ncbi:YggT family protein [Alphaproteobacteria bacterium LSUCC0684]
MIINLLNLVNLLVSLYVWTMLAYVLSSWLIAFRIINPYQPFVRMIMQALSALHDPILEPIRRWQYRLIPNLGGLDLSPVVALIVVEFLIAPLIRSALISLLT